MLEQISNPIQFVAHFVASGVGATGLTVIVDIRKWDGATLTIIATDAATTELGGGLYGYSLVSGSVSNESLYIAVFKTVGTADQKHLPALWCVGKAGIEKLDASISSRSTVAAIWDALISGLTTVGSIGKFIVDSLSSQAGTGARVVEVTVTDGTDPIEGALVRFSKGGETFVQSTNVDGEKAFSLDDGTWTVSITANGFSFTPTTLLVDGNEIVTYVMTPVVTPTPSPGEGQVTGVGNVYDEYGELDSSKTVYAQMILAARATGFFDGKVAEYTPIAGIVTIPKLFKTATYQFWIGNSSKRLKFYVPETGEDSIDLPPILGDECDDCTA